MVHFILGMFKVLFCNILCIGIGTYYDQYRSSIVSSINSNNDRKKEHSIPYDLVASYHSVVGMTTIFHISVNFT